MFRGPVLKPWHEGRTSHSNMQCCPFIELVVSEGAVALLREAGVDFVAPASLVLGCKREKSGEAVVLIAAAAPTSGSVAEPPRRHVVPFASEAHGDALADAVGDILARRALEAVPSF